MNSKIYLALLLVFFVGCEFQKNQGLEKVRDATIAPPEFTVTPPTDKDPTPPPDVVPPIITDGPPGDAVYDSIGLVVNGGAPRTTDAMLHLELINSRDLMSSMKITFNSDCSGGEWEDYAATKEALSPKDNQALLVSVRFRDLDFTTSQCISRQIIHDNKGPEIIFSKYPSATLEEGSIASLIYSVTDASAITSVSCRLNDMSKPCAAGTNDVEITALPVGTYVFAVDAQDELGNRSHQEVSWKVDSTINRVRQYISINDYKKVDILIVDDNSGSMNYEQSSMAKRVSNFLSILNGLDWRIAVTTTDPTATVSVNTTDPAKTTGMVAPGGTNPYRYVSDGLFLPVYGSPGQFYFDASMVDVQAKLGMTIQRPETGSGQEEAINATYRAIERGMGDPNNNPVQHDFFREGANFAVVVISDEDESANGPKDDPQNLVTLIHDSFFGQKAFSWHSIITRPGDTACKSTYGAVYGERYNQLSLLTGGLVGSVCETDYATQLMGVADQIRQLTKTMTLTCPPLTALPIVVTKDGLPYADTFVVEGVNLKFATELPAGRFAIEYSCLK